MSASFGRAVVAGLLHNGVRVLYPLGDTWLTNGNGQTSDYRGLTWHHTATGYSNTAPAVLWKGRPDLSGPLCNTSGNADGSVSMIAAHPANHAGASGGRSMGPLPVTRTFNRHVWGHEIVYPGDKPMTAAQYRTMLILGGVISGILRRPTAEWCRGHAETSITGKWDPGHAPGKTIDLAVARRETWAALNSPPPPVAQKDWFTMATKDELHAAVREVVRAELGFARDQIMTHLGLDPTAGPRPPEERAAVEVARRNDVGYVLEQVTKQVATLAAKPGTVGGPAQLSDADVQRIATAVIDLLARRAAA